MRQGLCFIERGGSIRSPTLCPSLLLSPLPEKTFARIFDRIPGELVPFLALAPVSAPSKTRAYKSLKASSRSEPNLIFRASGKEETGAQHRPAFFYALPAGEGKP